MAKLSPQNQKTNASNNATTTAAVNNANAANKTVVTKVKRTRRSVPRDSPPQRSSIYRGVTRHRWTGRYEAHLWDKNCWNESQNKKGRQVYLGAYDDEEAAAHAYDLAALKYWGQDTILNFPLATYHKEMNDMEGQSREEYIGSLRRKSSGFSRGVSKYRGVARHHHNGRWEARIGRVFGNKYLYLGTYATQEEAATAYDMAAIEYRGLNAVTNFDLSRYIKWLKPNGPNNDIIAQTTNPNVEAKLVGDVIQNPNDQDQTGLGFFHNLAYSPPEEITMTQLPRPTTATSALGLLLQSSKFKEMMEMTTATDSSMTSSSLPELPQCTFPDDIQTYFDCQDSTSYGDGDGDDAMFSELNSYIPSMFQCDFTV
ncbi:AP2-like ethylene-responsive transcription factor At1g16060 [Rosa chinensis]|uniref:AP2-like ethylene-responsive transcription factor At1g16060 n=1 Tax=Rosa chinensis TaxID=74649 RepID=UPI000D08E686|nr:AP2-like ethylene-responsive transcription factor At1g16060 [Rosa chinensis]